MTVISDVVQMRRTAKACFQALAHKSKLSVERGISNPKLRPEAATNSVPCHDNTLIIFDWDDTLLCSSALRQGDAAASKAGSTGLASLGKMVLSVLELAESLGNLAIVTNAKAGWVQGSAAILLPMILPFLLRIPVIYAREEHSKLFPSSSMQWKLQTFRELQRLNATVTNVVVVGDSNDEIQAAGALRMELPALRVKQVKLLSRPSLPELGQQLELLRGELRRVVQSLESETLEVLLEPGLGESPFVGRIRRLR
mmetsp:Transcript_65333/g.142359  ORF Transcript_65333/g.142359 Transcript_65333/m.142359 type:complete len:255 (+) Transcript_65333:36-800(+)